MPNQAQLALGDSGSAPQTYTVPKAQLIRLVCAHASYDGAAAAGNYLPAIELLSDAGEVVGRFLAGQAVAGDSAEVTFGAFLGDSTGIRFGVFNLGSFLDITSADYIQELAQSLHYGISTAPLVFVSADGTGVNVIADDQTFTQNPSISIRCGGNLDLTGGDVAGNNTIFVRLDGANGPVPPGGSLRVFFGSQELFRVNRDGSLQGRTGKALTFNL